ncbi:MAG: hypothetical protein ABGZ35_14945 [Planctomycetaceae bacterium]|jgi:hypothetical protein
MHEDRLTRCRNRRLSLAGKTLLARDAIAADELARVAGILRPDTANCPLPVDRGRATNGRSVKCDFIRKAAAVQLRRKLPEIMTINRSVNIRVPADAAGQSMKTSY